MATKYKCPMTVSATKKALPSPKSLLVNKPISSDLQCEDEKQRWLYAGVKGEVNLSPF